MFDSLPAAESIQSLTGWRWSECTSLSTHETTNDFSVTFFFSSFLAQQISSNNYNLNQTVGASLHTEHGIINNIDKIS